MKTKLMTIKTSKEYLDMLGGLKLKALTSFKIKNIIKQVNEEYSQYIETQNERIKHYGEEIEGEVGQYKFSPENKSKLQKELDELCNKEIELTFEPIPIEELGEVEIEANLLVNLDWVFKG